MVEKKFKNLFLDSVSRSVAADVASPVGKEVLLDFENSASVGRGVMLDFENSSVHLPSGKQVDVAIEASKLKGAALLNLSAGTEGADNFAYFLREDVKTGDARLLDLILCAMSQYCAYGNTNPDDPNIVVGKKALQKLLTHSRIICEIEITAGTSIYLGGRNRKRTKNLIQRQRKKRSRNSVLAQGMPTENPQSINARNEGVTTSYIDIGDCESSCEHCNAKFWYGERLKGCPKNQRPEYHKCCVGGKMFAMTSFGAHVDESVNRRRGPYVFKIFDQVYHWIGSLCPSVGDQPRFLQLYVYDTQNEVANRTCHFGRDGFSSLNQEIVRGLILFLDEHNELVKLFQTARDKCNGLEIPEFRIRLYSMVGAQEYDLPTYQTLGTIMFEDRLDTSTDYDVIIESKDWAPQRINNLHPSYMTLQFPLLFVFAVQNSKSSAQQDALILSVIEQLKTQVIKCTKINLDNKSVNDTLTVDLERYKEQVKVLKEGQNIDLKSKDNISDLCEQFVKIDHFKQTLSEHLKEKESLMQTVTLLKNDFKKEESRNIDREITLEKKIKQLDNIFYKRDQSAQTVHMLTKPQFFYDHTTKQALCFQNPFYLKKVQQLEPKLYNGNVIENTSAIVIHDSEETLMLAKESRSKMLLKQQDPMVLEKKVNTTPIDYAVLNQLSQDFEKRFVPQLNYLPNKPFGLRIL
ncbi:hypothetical protein Tco_0893137 [Tanacetum coccineum]|uniref:Uncharacterized protein n=1 Tax=Tanacetum coccineum TaxID=301880 RepID=A0ABQ5C7Y2_9ASTR